jgi:diketogulonate reductase-like aldo/keto reductase
VSFPYGSDRDHPQATRIATTQYRERVTERNLTIADAVNELAAERDASPAQVAIAWVRAQQQRATVIPIVGARTSTQIHDSLRAVDIELSAKELDRLEKQSSIDLRFPHDFAGRAMAHGTTFELVDDHRRHGYTQLGPAPLATVDVGGSD